MQYIYSIFLQLRQCPCLVRDFPSHPLWQDSRGAHRGAVFALTSASRPRRWSRSSRAPAGGPRPPAAGRPPLPSPLPAGKWSGQATHAAQRLRPLAHTPIRVSANATRPLGPMQPKHNSRHRQHKGPQQGQLPSQPPPRLSNATPLPQPIHPPNPP